ncbi:MAG: hypothetical protein HYR56_11195 [Acidobacteria bacterium]|nr:hypothetical protein [Acidobacteriota bacterium]MBI3424651.1 hypothetical protein [Acidobacteriota bacterium]
MNSQSGTLEITGLNPKILQALDQRAKAFGTTAEAYVRTLIEQDSAQFDFTPEQFETLRQEVLFGGEQIRQGHCSPYDTVDEMMDEIEATIQVRLAKQ